MEKNNFMMNKPKLHFSAIYKMAFESFKSNGWMLVGLFIVLGLITAAPILLGGLLTVVAQHAAPIVLGYLASIVLIVVTGTIYINALVQISKEGSITFAEVMKAWKKAPGFFAVCFLYLLIVLGGMILFVIPGIIWSAQFFLAPMIYLAEGVSVTEALHQSSVRTNGYKFDVLASHALLNQMVSYVLMPAYYIAMIVIFMGGLLFSGMNNSALAGVLVTILLVLLAIVFGIFLWVATQIVSLATTRTYVELSK